MKNILSLISLKNPYFIVFLALALFFAVRLIILQKPNTELTYTVKRENLVDSVQVSGTYNTASQTPVNSPTNGIIDKLNVGNGELVKKGQLIFHVESTATLDQQKIAYANYLAALGSLNTSKNAKQSLDVAMWTAQQAYLAAQNAQNYKNNHDQNPATKNAYTDLEKFAIDNAVTQTQKDFQAAEQAYKTGDVSINTSSAQVAQTKEIYDETQSTSVYAPATGTVVNLSLKVGDQVTAVQSASLSPALPVLVIANLGNPYISTNISEDYATRVTNGQKVNIVFNSLKDQSFTGSIEALDMVGTNTQGVVFYTARISVDNLPRSIKPNMTALIDIETLRRDNIIDVPNSAIITKNGKNYVQQAVKHNLIAVQVGTKGISKTEIISGLAVGTIIVASPN